MSTPTDNTGGKVKIYDKIKSRLPYLVISDFVLFPGGLESDFLFPYHPEIDRETEKQPKIIIAYWEGFESDKTSFSGDINPIGTLCVIKKKEVINNRSGKLLYFKMETRARVKITNAVKLSSNHGNAQAEMYPIKDFDTKAFQTSKNYKVLDWAYLFIWEISKKAKLENAISFITKRVKNLEEFVKFNEKNPELALNFLAHTVNFLNYPLIADETYRYEQNISVKLYEILEKPDIFEQSELLGMLVVGMFNGFKIATSSEVSLLGNSPLKKQYEKIKDKLSREANSEILKQLTQLKRARASGSFETSYVEKWLELALYLPWGVYTEDEKDLNKAKNILDQDHAFLKKVKDRVIEYLAAQNKNNATILCFMGPPGTGKTSVGESIARALGRKFTRLSLGGVKDEAFLRGHRITYIGAVCGEIIKCIKNSGSFNPVFLLDEVDKTGKDWRGDITSTLLEILDSVQNKNFLDHYLDFPFDLSRVFFVCTANYMENIPRTLRDRMEFIRFDSYTYFEKLEIAKKHLIPKVKKALGLPLKLNGSTTDIEFSDESLIRVIEGYTQEAGVRELERRIKRISEKIITNAKLNGKSRQIKITGESVKEYLGIPIFRETKKVLAYPVGYGTVFAVNDFGGFSYPMEAALTWHRHRDKPEVKLTGVLDSKETSNIANKIKESVHDAFSFLTSSGGILDGIIKKKGCPFIHVKIGNGSIPKDGPSAGVTALCCLYGAMRNQPIRPGLGMTGEISLIKGEISAVGGIRNKAIAAQKTGITTLLIPKDNEANLEDIPKEILENIEIKLIDTMSEALLEAFGHIPKEREKIKKHFNLNK